MRGPALHMHMAYRWASLVFGACCVHCGFRHFVRIVRTVLVAQIAWNRPLSVDEQYSMNGWQLSQRDEALIDVTEHDAFKWWPFLSNLGPNTQKAFGSGITSVQIHKRENMIGLRTEHTDAAVQWVILSRQINSFKTMLATSFE